MDRIEGLNVLAWLKVRIKLIEIDYEINQPPAVLLQLGPRYFYGSFAMAT